MPEAAPEWNPSCNANCAGGPRDPSAGDPVFAIPRESIGAPQALDRIPRKREASASRKEDPKLCTSCGKEVTHRDRRKNREGEYFCVSCYNQASIRCAACNQESIRRNSHRNRYGEYICSSCYEQGKRASPRRSASIVLKKYSRIVLYVLVALAGLWISYWMFSMIVDKYTSAVISVDNH